jgi:hypothetical protein
MAEDSFATAINCMDGRTQIPVIEYMKKTCGVDYVDTVTEPGPDGILGDKTNMTLIESIRKRVEISVQKHGSKNVAVIAHHDCAGNPVEPKVHLEQVERAVELVRSWGHGCRVFALWLDQHFEVHLVDEAFKAEVRG